MHVIVIVVAIVSCNSLWIGLEWNGLDWTRLDWTGLHYIGFYHDTRTEYNGMPCHAVFHGPRQEALRVTVTATFVRHVTSIAYSPRRGEASWT